MARTTATRATATTASSSSSIKRTKQNPMTGKKGTARDNMHDNTSSSHANGVTGSLDPEKQAEQERVALKKEEAILGIENALKKFSCSLCKRHVESHHIRPMKLLLNNKITHAKSSRKTVFKAKSKTPKQSTSEKLRASGRRGYLVSDDESESDVDDTTDNSSENFDSVTSIEDRDSAKDNLLSLDDTISEAAGIKSGCIELLEPTPTTSSRKKLSAVVDFSTNLACGHIFCVDCRSKDGKLFKETGKKINLTCPVMTLGRPCGLPLNRTEIQNPNGDTNAREVQLYMRMKRNLVELRRLDVRQPDCMDQICLLLDTKHHASSSHASETPSEADTPSSTSSSSVYRRRITNISAASSAINNNGISVKNSSWKTSRNPLKQILYKLRSTLFPKASKQAAAPQQVALAEAEVGGGDVAERNKRDRTATASSSNEADIPAVDGNANGENDRRRSARSRPPAKGMQSNADTKNKVRPPSAKKFKLHVDNKNVDEDNVQEDEDTLKHAALSNRKPAEPQRRRSSRRRTAVVSLINEKQSKERKPLTKSSYRQSNLTSPTSSGPISDADVTIYDVPSDDSSDDDDEPFVLDGLFGENGVMHADLSVSPDSLQCLGIKRSRPTALTTRQRGGKTNKNNWLNESGGSSGAQRRRLEKYKFCVSKSRTKKPDAPATSKSKRRRQAPPQPVAAEPVKVEESKPFSEEERQLHFGFNQLDVDVAGVAGEAKTDKRISAQYAGNNKNADIDDMLLLSLNRGLNALNVDKSKIDDDDGDADVLMKSVLHDDDRAAADDDEAISRPNGDADLPGLPDDGNDDDIAVAEARDRARAAQQHRMERKQMKKADKITELPPIVAVDSIFQPRMSQFSRPVNGQSSSNAAASNTLFSLNDRTAVTSTTSVHTIITQSSQGLNSGQQTTVSVVDVGARSSQQQPDRTSQETNSVDLSILTEPTAPADEFVSPENNSKRRNAENVVTAHDVFADLPAATNKIALQPLPSNLTRRESLPRSSLRMPANSSFLRAASHGPNDVTHTPKPHSTPIADHAARGGAGAIRHMALALDISPIQHLSPVASSAPAGHEAATSKTESEAAFCFNSAAVRQVAGVSGLQKRRPSQFAVAGENGGDAPLNFDAEPQLPATSSGMMPATAVQTHHPFPDEDLSGNNLNVTRRSSARRAAAAARAVEKPQPNANMARKVMTQQAYSAAAAAAVEEPPLPPVRFDFGPEQPPSTSHASSSRSRALSRAIDLDDLVAFGPRGTTAVDNLAEAYRTKQRRENRQRNTRDFVLCSTGVNTPEQLAAIKKFARQILHAKYDRNFTRATTHLIVMCDKKAECPRTLKYLQCIAQQKYCVSYAWVENALGSLRNGAAVEQQQPDWLDEFRFLARGDNTMQYDTPCDAPRRAVTFETKPLARVLAYFGVHQPDDTKTDADLDKDIVTGITRRNYLELLKDMGAQVVLDYKQFTRAVSSSGGFQHKVWIVESYNEKESTTCNLLGPSTHYVDISWLLECISTFSLLAFQAYRPSPPSDEEMGQTFDIDEEEEGQ